MERDKEFSEEEVEEESFEEDSEDFEDVGEEELDHSLRTSEREVGSEEDFFKNSSFSDNFEEDFSVNESLANISAGNTSLGAGGIRPVRRVFTRLEDVAEEAPATKEDEEEENKNVNYRTTPQPEEIGGSTSPVYTELGAGRTRRDFEDEPVGYLTPTTVETGGQNSFYRGSRAEGSEIYKSGKRERIGEKKSEREKEKERLERLGLGGSLRGESSHVAEESFGEGSNEDRARKYN